MVEELISSDPLTTNCRYCRLQGKCVGRAEPLEFIPVFVFSCHGFFFLLPVSSLGLP